MTRLAWALAVVAVILLTFGADAGAQRRRRDRRPPRPVDPVQAAEEAFSEVDFERTLEHAGNALQAGGHTPQRMVRIYQLLGVSAAALGDLEGAREFFQRMLAIDGDAELDDSVPPRLRAPYLEARGIVAARPDRLGVEVGLARAQASLRIALTDPFELARTVRIHARIEGTVEYTTVEVQAEPQAFAPLAGADTADRVEYWVEVLDEYGNQVLVVGTEFEPRVVGRVVAASASGSEIVTVTSTPTSSGNGRTIFEEPVFWIVAASVLVVGGAIAVGVGVDSASRVPLQTAISIGAR